MPTDAKHAASEEVRGSADDSHTGQCAKKERRRVVCRVHLHQHRGPHKHKEDHEKRRQDPHVWRHPTNTAHTHRDVPGLGGSLYQRSVDQRAVGQMWDSELLIIHRNNIKCILL